MLQIFKIFHKKKDKIEKIYVFGNKTDLKQQEIDKLNKYKCDIEYINAYIHLDDNIITVKQKIFYFLKKAIPIDEMYLFSKKKETLLSEKVFNNLTQNGTINLDYQKIYNYFINLNDTSLIQKIKDTDGQYLFEDFKKLLKDKEYTVDIPLGFKFIIKKKVLNTVNPYNFINIDSILKYNFEYTFSGENKKLLFEYGDIIDNTIYLTYAEDILSNFEASKERDIIKSYFPNLFNNYLRKDEQITFQDIKKKRNDKLEEDNKIKQFYDDKQHENVDLFYTIKDNDKRNVNYGIKKIMFTIHQQFKIKIPLETLFKLIKTSEKIPLIKYNPGNRRENIYRLYTNKVSTDGKKIPYLYNLKKKNNEIIKIGHALATKKKLGFYIRYKLNDELIHVFCELLENSLIEVHINFDSGKNIEQIEKIVKETINKYILDPIYTYFQDSGYKYYKFETLKHANIEINNIDYVFKIKNEIGINLREHINWISNIFEVSQPILTSNKNIEMRYKKISYYNKMNSINSFIIEQMQIGKDSEYILRLLMDNYNLSIIEAKGHIGSILNEIKIQVDLFENKKVFRDHPGFPIEISQKTELINGKYENINIIQITKINNINYINFIKMYINSLFQIILQDIKDPNILKQIKKIKDKKLISISQEKDKVAIVEKEFTKRSSVNISENKLELSDNDSSDDDFLDGLGFGDIGGEDSDDDKKEKSEELLSIGSDFGDLDNISLAGDDDDNDELDDEPNDQTITNLKSQTNEKLDLNLDLNNIKLKGTQSFFIKRLRDRDPGLFSSNEQDEHFQAYTKSCQSQYMKQPIALTDAEKKWIDKKDKEQNIKSYDEHITYGVKKKNHYICPRFWCLRDDKNEGRQRSLSVKQVNDGECGGWDAVIPWEKHEMKKHKDMVPPGKRIIEINSVRMNLLDHYDDIKKDKTNLLSKIVYKPYVPNFQTKKDEKMCLPCCYKKATFDAKEDDEETLVEKRTEQQIKNKEDQFYKYMYEPSSNMPKCKKNKQCIDAKGNVIWENIEGQKTRRGFSMSNSYDKDGKTKLKPNGAQQKSYEKCDEDKDTKKAYLDRRMKNKKDKNEKVLVEQQLSDDSDINEKPLTVSFPLQNKQLGYLLPQISKFLQYNVINKCYISINDTGLKINSHCLLRKGVERKNKQSFLSCISNIYNDMLVNKKDTERTIVDDVIKVQELKEKIIENLTIDKFISYQNGNLIKLFETNDNKKHTISEKIKNSKFFKNIKKITSANKINEIISAYENYKKFIWK